ncbi:hypothetical protein PAAG_06285 [Paracoccidioides lutzii Pb01]|uniref:Uncharacterized protein n=1 Tax=Paracoccidioides lutzii (strain ATCC MYA-826 / Pb01) TaxID=502779 RepID=C1H5U0_PARBA|nr:hypothetical protein PAAG_06285 [Paracoccidioides lutzii Pb01]EEH35238.2 hypothetical protein PAAG_06285 [Paracoccidioides lutzii Pb01]
MKSPALLTFILALLVTFVTPLAVPQKNSLEKRGPYDNACPPVRTISGWMTYAKGWDGSKAVFWTADSDANDAKDFARQICGTYYYDLMNDMQWVQWEVVCTNQDEKAKLIPRASQAMAMATKGTAYIMIQEGAFHDRPSSTWWNVEYPVLLKNNVNVIAVNPREPGKFEQRPYNPGENPPPVKII